MNKAREWLTGKGDEVLGDWDISRDAPYFGIPIPDAPGKYFYVWLDAPVGYLASLKNYFDTGGVRARGETRTFEQFLTAPDTEQIHFIGKDIIYFHTLFWPAMLKFAGAPYRTPSHVYVHGFITVSGEKMSKSRGTGISPLRYLELGMNAEWLRYYIAAKLNSDVEDIDFNPDDFVARVNSDLIGKYVNIASRCAGFISKRFAGKVSRPHNAAAALLNKLQSSEQCWAPIGRLYANREYGKALREISNLLDQINQYIDEYKPWELAKLPANDAKLHEVCSTALAMFWYTSILLSPVLPATAAKVREFLNLSPEQMKWGQDTFFPAGHVINPYSHLMTRVDPKQLDALFDAGKDAAPAAPTATAKIAAAASASVAAPKAAPGAAAAAAAAAPPRAYRHRRVSARRPAGRESARCAADHRRRQAAEVASRRGRTRTAGDICRHSLGLRSGNSGGSAHRRGCKFGTAQDAFWDLGGHDGFAAGPGGVDIFGHCLPIRAPGMRVK